MKIAILGTIWLNTPPSNYGGTEDVIYNLANGLSQKGHDVTLFAPATTKTKARLSPTVTLPLRQQDIPWTEISYHLYHIAQAFERKEEFDVLHVHLNKNSDYLSLPLAASSTTPVVTTIHFSLPKPPKKHDRYQILTKYKDLPYTSISASQQKDLPLNFIATVYNALPLEHFPFSDNPQEYVAWLGKIVPHKGTKEAILAAKKAGIPIKVAGVVDEGVAESKNYFEKEVKPLLDTTAEYVGPVNQQEKAALLGGAKALLNPIQWEEPFGLVMVEAQAVGTPVIAFNRGAAGEVIEDGTTGFLVDSVDEMAAKVSDVNSLNRQTIRDFIAQKFTLDNMVSGYEMAYEAAVEHWETYMLQLKNTLARYRDKPAEV